VKEPSYRVRVPHVTERASSGSAGEAAPTTGLLPGARPVVAHDDQLAQVRYTADGLVPAIVQDAADGAVLMMGWMTEETLRLTLAEGRTVFWSRSRGEVWRKGDTSGEVQLVREAYYDCDGDVLLFVVDQAGGGACHTGERTCFFRAFGPGGTGGAGGAPQ
jgi:phosphoribosyl-AMP cyclohydrolase